MTLSKLHTLYNSNLVKVLLLIKSHFPFVKILIDYNGIKLKIGQMKRENFEVSHIDAESAILLRTISQFQRISLGEISPRVKSKINRHPLQAKVCKAPTLDS